MRGGVATKPQPRFPAATSARARTSWPTRITALPYSSSGPDLQRTLKQPPSPLCTSGVDGLAPIRAPLAAARPSEGRRRWRPADGYEVSTNFEEVLNLTEGRKGPYLNASTRDGHRNKHDNTTRAKFARQLCVNRTGAHQNREQNCPPELLPPLMGGFRACTHVLTS